MSGTTEAVLRALIGAGWFAKAGGSTALPVGYFSLVEVPTVESERDEAKMFALSGNPVESAAFDTLEQGWYFVVQKNDGSLTYRFCISARDAFTLFDEADEALTSWVAAQ